MEEKIIRNDIKLAQYNDIPVKYCFRCCSLRVVDIRGTEYCDECGSPKIQETDIHQWERRYKAFYGYKFLDKKVKHKPLWDD